MKDIFEVISEICESDNINDAEWVKDKLKEAAKENSKEAPTPQKLSALCLNFPERN